MVAVLQAFLVPADLAVQLVHQLVDGRVEVLVRLLDEDVAALDVERDLGALTPFLLPQLVHREEDVHIDDLVEMSCHAIELGEHVLAQSRRHAEVVTADDGVHLAFSCLLCLRGSQTVRGSDTVL